MLAFICMLPFVQGPLAEGAEVVPAALLLARVEREAGLAIERADGDMDGTPILCREPGAVAAAEALLLLRAHGIYVHASAGERGEPLLKATRDPSPPPKAPRRVTLGVYAPVYVQPEDLVARLEASEQGAGVSARIERRTGKIVLMASGGALEAALDFLAGLDRPLGGSSRHHVFKCRGVFVRSAEEKLLKLLSREVRGRVVLVSYERINTLLVSAAAVLLLGIAELLAKIDPQGERL